MLVNWSQYFENLFIVIVTEIVIVIEIVIELQLLELKLL